MSARRTATLRFRVTALAALAVLAVLAAAAAGLLLVQRATLTDALDESLVDRAAAAAAQLRAGQPVDPLVSDDVTVRVVPGDGARAAVSDGTLPDGSPARVVTRPAGGATVVVTGSLEDVEDSVRVLRGALLVAVPITTAVLAALVWLLTGRVLRPVERIRAEVDRISAGRLDRRVPEPATADEIARLAHTMNAMLDRLAGAAERQRRFVADAAHELRTPLARIRTQLEVDRAHPATAGPEVTSAAVLAEAGRLQRLVDDLLLLARSDSWAAELAAAGPVDLDDVVLTEVRRVRGAGGPGIDTAGVAPAQVSGDRGQLARAVANLLDNAVRHAEERVTVTLREDDGTAVLTVADDGAGIPPEARESVFERFTRLDGARSADAGGAGLGLPIARDIAVRHGGGLVLDGEPAHCARFVLTLPLHPYVSDPGRGGRPTTT
ncbi:ATP-binding protein [Geodermatophilus sp. URMC 64]